MIASGASWTCICMGFEYTIPLLKMRHCSQSGFCCILGPKLGTVCVGLLDVLNTLHSSFQEGAGDMFYFIAICTRYASYVNQNVGEFRGNLPHFMLIVMGPSQDLH